ncbi:hypothetical protein BABINDRAFT_159920 [Babjeviella inositovora NRRL Y-12698]|uniref:Carbonic anhydrase n=1 Tax=Babjeviella inositovora NRRL Y-12698 TaxID=984486 RepID=A0A1E3QVH1_9ASCO|nr:uncharacterized protein BABINDRAFT_159920 [Babjeviella inositovora NRRL Y-12698]ODQ81658.1 hypothetical protein BABINDRAFT_159920 [Babjeviella inositovora NRRL Y-12698]
MSSHSSINDETLPHATSSNSASTPFKLTRDSTLKDFLRLNQTRANLVSHNHPEIYPSNGKGQSPHTLWIGCSDSRAGESCLDVLPGEIFLHRNIANVISPNDVSSTGAIQFAVDVLKVKKVIVCGHTDCGGIHASLSSKKIGGVLDHWLNPIRHVRAAHLKELNALGDAQEKCTRLSTLNVISSVHALRRHPSASAALKRGEIEVWGLMYDCGTGLLREVEIPDDEFEDLFHMDEHSIELPH